jgi:hypothetical protein
MDWYCLYRRLTGSGFHRNTALALHDMQDNALWIGRVRAALIRLQVPVVATEAFSRYMVGAAGIHTVVRGRPYGLHEQTFTQMYWYCLF